MAAAGSCPRAGMIRSITNKRICPGYLKKGCSMACTYDLLKRLSQRSKTGATAKARELASVLAQIKLLAAVPPEGRRCAPIMEAARAAAEAAASAGDDLTTDPAALESVLMHIREISRIMADGGCAPPAPTAHSEEVHADVRALDEKLDAVARAVYDRSERAEYQTEILHSSIRFVECAIRDGFTVTSTPDPAAAPASSSGIMEWDPAPVRAAEEFLARLRSAQDPANEISIDAAQEMAEAAVNYAEKRILGALAQGTGNSEEKLLAMLEAYDREHPTPAAGKTGENAAA